MRLYIDTNIFFIHLTPRYLVGLGNLKDRVAIYLDGMITRGTGWRECVGIEGLVLAGLDNQVAMCSRQLYTRLEARTLNV